MTYQEVKDNWEGDTMFPHTLYTIYELTYVTAINNYMSDLIAKNYYETHQELENWDLFGDLKYSRHEWSHLKVCISRALKDYGK